MSNHDELEQLEKSLDELTETVAEAFGAPAVAIPADDDGGTTRESELQSLEAEVADLESSLNNAMNKVATQTWDERVAKLAADENIPTHIGCSALAGSIQRSISSFNSLASISRNQTMGANRAANNAFISRVREP